MNDNSVEQAQAAFDKKPSYFTALMLQKAKRERDAQIEEIRKEWFEIEGDAGQHSIPDLEVMISAMREVMDAVDKGSDALNKGSVLLYVYKVAQQSLIAIGRKDS